MGLDLGSIEFYAGPTVLGGPDDLDAVVRSFISGAEKRLLIAVQELDSRAIAEAILAAKVASVRVQLILEGDYLAEDPPVADPWAEVGDNEDNRAIHSAVLRAGVDVITDLNPKIFHQKFMVRDPGLPTAAVLTGSTNFTLTDTGKNPPGASPVSGNNLNHVVVLHGERVAEQYLEEFLRYRGGTFGELHERHEPKPSEFRLANIRVKPLFAPMHGPEMELMKQMLKARTSIDFAMFTFAESSGIDDTMIRLAASYQRIRGVLDRAQGAQDWAATQPLKAAGVQLFQNKPGDRSAQGASQADGPRRADRDRRELQLHGAGDNAQRREHHRARRSGGERSSRRSGPAATRRVRARRDRTHHRRLGRTRVTVVPRR